MDRFVVIDLLEFKESKNEGIYIVYAYPPLNVVNLYNYLLWNYIISVYCLLLYFCTCVNQNYIY